MSITDLRLCVEILFIICGLFLWHGSVICFVWVGRNLGAITTPHSFVKTDRSLSKIYSIWFQITSIDYFMLSFAYSIYLELSSHSFTGHAYILIYLFIYSFIYLFIYLFIHLFIYLFIYFWQDTAKIFCFTWKIAMISMPC